MGSRVFSSRNPPRNPRMVSRAAAAQTMVPLASLLGILHHQRPGFLSFPSSHTVPYLRGKAFPRWKYPKLYEYRSHADRFEAKVERAFRRVPELDCELTRHCYSKSAHLLTPPSKT